MTIEEFHINFGLELDKTQDFEYPSFIPEQIDYWLNKAQDELIKDCLSPDKSSERAFEETQDKLEDIRTIVIESPVLTSYSNDGGDTYITNLPSDYLYRLRHNCITYSDICSIKKVGGIFTKQLFINNMLKDPFWTPSVLEPIYYIVGNTIRYPTKKQFVVSGTYLTYVKNPSTMRLGSQYVNPTTDVQCELPEYSHTKLLARAVSMVLENIESQRYQTNLNELNKIE